MLFTAKEFEPNFIKRQFLKLYFLRLGIKHSIIYRADRIKNKKILEEMEAKYSEEV
jgi:hypothetical protein